MRISFFAGVSATILTCNDLQSASAVRIEQQNPGKIYQDNNLA